jgi:hypothetical protein
MMDTLAMFVFIWCLCVLVILYLGKFLYNKYVKKNATASTDLKATPPTNLAVPVVPAADKLRSSEPREISEKRSTRVRTILIRKL